MFERLFELAPTPHGLLKAEREGRLQDLLRPLGLQNRRADLLRRLTEDWLSGKPPGLCHGVGRYALDAWAIFVEGRTDVSPSDHFLKPYLAWRKKYGSRIEWGDGADGRAEDGFVVVQLQRAA
jgi:methyl-CpG-binding domain protein 4